MKQGKKPTRNQKKFFIEKGLNPAHWLIVKNQTHVIIIVHRSTSEIRTIKK